MVSITTSVGNSTASKILNFYEERTTRFEGTISKKIVNEFPQVDSRGANSR